MRILKLFFRSGRRAGCDRGAESASTVAFLRWPLLTRENENDLVLELIEMHAAQFGHEMVFPETMAELATDERLLVIRVSFVSIRASFPLAAAGRDLTVY